MIAGGWLRALGVFLGVAEPRATFANPVKPIDAAVRAGWFGPGGGRISRSQALSVPAVLKGRNLMCSLATLPLVERDAARAPVANPWLRQFDPDVANIVHLAQTVEDLLFDSISWWEITAFSWTGFPAAAVRRDPATVSLDPPAGSAMTALPSGAEPHGVKRVWIDGRPVDASNVIRFDSPNPPVLVAAARAIRKALRLDETAEQYASEPEASGYFRTAEGADEPDDDDIESILSQWQARRRSRLLGWIPRALEYVTVSSPSPKDLQLVELQERAGLEVANALGVDPEELGVSTTSRTYANVVDRRKDKINDVLAPYMRAITDRLSMPDCTPRGHVVEFDLVDYLKSNPTERWNVYAIALDKGVMTVPEVRAAEGWPALPAEPEPTPAEPAPEPEAPAAEPADEPAAEPANVDAAAAAHQFAGGRASLTLDAATHNFAADAGSRTMTGLIVPFGRPASKYGLTFVFRKGALQWADPRRVKLLRDHNPREALGYAEELVETAAGIKAKFRLGRSPEADDALRDAEDGVLDGFSVGVDFDMSADVEPHPRNKAWMVVTRGDLRETSLTAVPAFDDARVTKVAASREGTNMDPDETTPGPAPDPAGGQPVQTFNQEQVQEIAREAVAEFARTQGAGTRETVDPTRRGPGNVQVTDPPSYRFDRRGHLQPGAYEFSADIIAGLRDGDRAAYDRVMAFARAQFDVVSTDVNELNMPPNRPDMYVDQRDYRYPVWDAISKGALTSITPFTFPKFNSASGLVGNHTEGSEPSSGAFTVTNQTVTPTAKSGKAKISRETWDQGGNPQIGDLIWRQMVKGLNEAKEAAAVALLDAASPTSLGTLTAGGGTGKRTLAAELKQGFVGLHFIRGGFAFTDAFTQIDLYKHLAAAEDADGQPLFPIIGPTNRDGQTGNRLQFIDVDGVAFLPAWALAASGSVAASSYTFDRESVHGWSSAPTRLTMDGIEVANVYIGLWAYVATAISDINGVREIIYDPVP